MTRQGRITYLVHDLNDPAVARRVRMWRAGGATVVIAGFHREARIPADLAGAPVIALGRTGDAKLVQRALQVLANIVRPGPLLRAVAGADVIVARNLECLVLGARARLSAPHARLVYECLDIHRILIGSSAAARAVQAMEARLLRGIDLLIVSSPAFLERYFARRPTLTAPSLLVENKLLILDSAAPVPSPAPSKPWTIGWFGNLRCRRTFTLLTDLARVLDGKLQILIAGRPSPAVFDDFAMMAAAAPHCRYVGPFTADELPSLYAQCHFAWAIDFFEEGLNSTWLLPNRLYEASSFDVVPIALRSVETGRWLARHDAGLLIDDGDPMPQLIAMFGALDEARYAVHRARMAGIQRADLIATADDCAALVATVMRA